MIIRREAGGWDEQVGEGRWVRGYVVSGWERVLYVT